MLTWTRRSSDKNSARGVAGGRGTRLCKDCLGLDFRSGTLRLFFSSVPVLCLKKCTHV